MSTRQLLADQIRERRKELGLRREAVAAGLQCSLRTYEDLERGTGPFPLDRLQDVAEILEMRLSIAFIADNNTQDSARVNGGVAA